MSEALLYLATGAAFLVLAVVIVHVQRRAGRCARHSRVAGALAWVLAGLSFLAGVGLLGLAGTLP